MTIRRGAGLALCMALAAPCFDWTIRSAGFPARLAAQENQPETTLADERNELARLQRKLRELRSQAMEARKTQVDRIKELASEKRVLERGLDGLKELGEKREAEIGKRRAETADNKKKIAELTKRADAIQKSFQKFLDRVDEHI